MRCAFFSSGHQIHSYLSTFKSSSAADRIHVSRRTKACLSRLCSSVSGKSYDFPAGDVTARKKVEGLNPTTTRQDFEATEAVQEYKNVDANGEAILRSDYGIKMSGGEQKNLLKQQLYEVRKAEIVAADKERRRREGERKRKAWDEKLASVGEEERLKLIEDRRRLRTETIMRMNEEKAQRMERLERAREHGQNIIIDLEFSHLMSPLEIKSLTRQIMFCYAANGKSSSPSHLWLTGCGDNMETQLLKIPGYENWIIEKERLSYIEIFKERKDDLVYMTPDAETVLDDIDPKKLYILGGLVDRTRQKGVTIKKARSQRIQTAKLPIQEYLKESSCKVSSPHFNISSLLST